MTGPFAASDRPFFTPAVVVLLVLAAAAASGLAWYFRGHDLELVQAATALPGSHDDWSFWWLVDDYGEVPTWIVLSAAALLFAASFALRKGALLRLQLGFILAVAAVGPGLLNHLVKALVQRPRPGDGAGFVPLFAVGPGRSDNGFPSGHTASAFVLLALAYLIPRTRPALRVLAAAVFLLWGATIGLARVVWGAHYPSDALFGGLLTMAVEGILWAAFFRRRIARAEAASG